MKPIFSPCILVCAIDDNTGFCYGCGRTGVEISMWANYHDDERNKIISSLDARLKTVERKPRRETKRRRLARQKNNSTDATS